jgi:hypothetical protein
MMWWLLWGVAVVLGARMAVHQARVVDRPANSFVAYYTSARLVVEGENPVNFYDRERFQRHVARFEPTVSEIFSANPPTMSVLLLPLSGLGYHEARAVWVAFSFLVVIATTVWLLRTLRITGLWVPVFASFVFGFHPLVATLEHGQVYAVVWALLAVVFHGFRKDADVAIGVPLGFLLVTKTAGLLIWPLLLFARRWRALAVAVGVAAVMVAVSWPWIGAAAWARYVREASELTQNPLLAVTAYQTVFGFCHHLFGAGGAAIGEPLIQLPVLATTLNGIITGILVIVTARAAYRSCESDLLFAAVILLGLILTPVTGAAHFTLALLSIAVLVADAPRQGTRYAFLLTAGALLIAADVPYRSPRLANGMLALLAYPKLYGTVLLWGLAVWRSNATNDERRTKN